MLMLGNSLPSAGSYYQLLQWVKCDGRGNPNGRAEIRRNNNNENIQTASVV
jgi:hypothetical protein